MRRTAVAVSVKSWKLNYVTCGASGRRFFGTHRKLIMARVLLVEDETAVGQ